MHKSISHNIFSDFNTVFLVLEEDGVTVAVLPRKEVIRRLRDRNEPITLYGESDIEAFRRLRKLEISEPEINRVTNILKSLVNLCKLKIILCLILCRVFVMISKKLWKEWMRHI